MGGATGRAFVATFAAALLLLPPAGRSATSEACRRDVDFALDELSKRCGSLIEQKQIDWAAVGREMRAAADAARDDSDHLLVLVRLVARLRDGHAAVIPLAAGKGIELPAAMTGERGGLGLFLCRTGGKVIVKSSFAEAAGAGIAPGMEVVKVDGRPAADWLAARVETLRDTECFSTEAQAFTFACHWGLAFPTGTRVELELKDAKGKRVARTITCGSAPQVPDGPAFLPDGLERTKDLKYGRTKAGFGYVHVRRCPDDLPQQMDVALAALTDAKGVILDFRGNSGGGFDHDALMGRFIPTGRSIDFAKHYASAGPNPYGGPVVVIIDATVRSAGETASGMFKEDGRAFCIGEGPTAGMSAVKEQFDLPSGKWALHVAVASNKGRFNGGRGLEAIGVIPDETVEYAPKELAAGIDSQIARAEALLKRFPQNKVRYDPKAFGWK